MKREKKFWIGLSLINLVLVATLGLLMRSKLLFPIPFLDYRSILSAHSHVAFGGWVGLALIVFLIYDVLPADKAQKKVYQLVLWGIEISSVGMAFSFPFGGYNVVAIIFSSLYIVITYVFGLAYFKELKRSAILAPIRRLSYGAVAFLMLSSIGPFTLIYIMVTKSANSLLYRDAIYTFLHLQYNGFFTLSVFAVFFSHWIKKGTVPPGMDRFSKFLLLSVLPSLFIALLWHNLISLYVIAGIGCLLMLLSVFNFLPIFRASFKQLYFKSSLGRFLLIASFVSFIIKMVLAIGTIYPPLGNAVYGARPVIIGFLHLVFLAFVSFYILSDVIERGYFHRHGKLISIPFYVFTAGVFGNELFLALQGLEILFKSYNDIYPWLLWGSAITLLTGAILLATMFYFAQASNKNAAATAAAITGFKEN